MVTAINPRTNSSIATIRDTTAEEVGVAVKAAGSAFERIAAMPRSWRAELLTAIADGLEASRDEIVARASEESGLGEPRLNGEVARTVYQFRLFAEAIVEGGYLEATIDHAGETPLGAAPEIRRMLHPIGPVAVFGASNFPLAFSVPGGDTASALAAGCPVVVKAHSSHPLTSQLCYDAMVRAADAAGAPEGTLGIVYGTKAGAALVASPGIRAVGFTGSLSGGKALMNIINNERDEPIPFYGELSSLNPLVITSGAADARGEEIAEGLFASVTGSAGQMCTKPGVAFVPRTAAGDALVEHLQSRTRQAARQVLLNGRVYESFSAIVGRLTDAAGSVGEVVSSEEDPKTEGFWAAPSMMSVSASELTTELTEECFGPFVLVVRYSSIGEVAEALDRIPQSLASTIHHGEGESAEVANLSTMLFSRSGRLVYNGYPTGVRVSWGQHHGGQWPATNSLHTSVGVSAIRRFLRPFAWQDAPQDVLPEELRDGFREIPRRVDGTLVVP